MKRKKALTTLAKIFLLAGALHVVSDFCNKQTDGFTLQKISSALPYDERFATPLPQGEELSSLQTILNQKFTYLGSGGQCYAFASDDDKYVIKFFKHHLRRQSPLYRMLPLPPSLAKRRTESLLKKEKKLERDFLSYKLSFDELKEETGLIYVHLNKTKTLHFSTTLVDKIGLAHTIALDPLEFVLQRKADLVYPKIDALMAKEEKELAEKLIASTVDLIVSRCKKGIFDEDARIHRNFGFLENKAILIDAGRLRKDLTREEKNIYQKDVKQITERMRVWLAKNHPELEESLTQKVQAVENE